MNAESGNIKNYLFVPSSANYTQDFQKFCIQCTKQDHTVLFITRQSTDFDFLPLLSQLDNIEVKERLKRFIIMNFQCIEDVTKKLLELHDWMHVPVLVVLDLYAFIVGFKADSVEDENVLLLPSPAVTMQSLCLCVATLFNYMNSVELRLLKLNSIAKENNTAPLAYSIVLLDSYSDVLTKKQLELIINLYFYDAAAFDNFDEITSKFF